MKKYKRIPLEGVQDPQTRLKNKNGEGDAKWNKKNFKHFISAVPAPLFSGGNYAMSIWLWSMEIHAQRSESLPLETPPSFLEKYFSYWHSSSGNMFTENLFHHEYNSSSSISKDINSTTKGKEMELNLMFFFHYVI